MNNEAFRKLLSSGGGSGNKGGKSTKEIAREAVEEEFRERRSKRGRDEDYLSDDDDNDDDDDDDDGDNRDNKKKSKKDEEKELAEEEAKAAKAEEKKNKKLKYRDRAKERRLGRGNIDYQDTHDIVNELDEDMTKFLGGDEEHTHLVKGLDKTLAEKVRRDEMGNQATEDIDLDQIMEEASAKANGKRKANVASSAKASISELKPNTSTTLACGMLSYLKQLEKRRKISAPCKDTANHISGARETASQAGKMISRTSLTFSLDGNIRDRDKSSELPEEKTMSIMQYERLQSRKPFTPCTPLDSNLISKIKTVFSSVKRDRKEVETKKGSKKKTGKKGAKKAGKQEGSKQISPPAALPDSDDDIFADAGDYVPPTRA